MAPPSYAAGGYFQRQMAQDELNRQDQARREQEKQYSRSWWKRGLGQGILGALPGLVTLNPVMAAAGAAGGFGGEAINHFGFKDKQPGIAGNAAALAALGSGAASKGLFSAGAEKVGLEGLQRGASNMGNNAAYNAEIAKASVPQFNSQGAALPGVGFGNGNTPQQLAQPFKSPTPEAIKFSPHEVPTLGQEITDFQGSGQEGFTDPYGFSADGELTPEEWKMAQRLNLFSGVGR